jgi:4-hydroxy-2-oxoheptanedioate aldolase
MERLSLRAALAGDRPLRVGWSCLSDPLAAEIMVRAGFEAVLIDLQHGVIDLGAAPAMLTAIRAAGGYALARIPVGEYQSASRLLDWGADMVVAPMIETADDARAFASFMKYPPDGLRSYGPARAVQLSGLSAEAYRTSANAATLAVVMIETAGALANLDAILAVPGIDGVFVGPFDLSIALSPDGEPGIDRPDTLAAMERVARQARAAGKVCGAFGANPTLTRRYLDLGFTFASLSTDMDLIAGAARAAIAEVEGND